MKQESSDILQINIGDIISKRRGKELPKFIANLLERLIHQDEINYILRTYSNLDGVAFMNALVKHFNLSLKVVGKDYLPQNGRALFVANHPLGGLDGICLSSIIGSHYRGSVKYIVNDLLFNLKPLQSIFVPVNKYGVQARTSVQKMNEALEGDLPVLTFPAGLCSRLINGQIQDIVWNKSFVKQAVEHKRDIVPIFFSGRNSTHFYAIEKIRSLLKMKFNPGTALLPDEMFRAKGKSFSIVVGEPIPYTDFTNLKSSQYNEAIMRVRSVVYSLPSVLAKNN